MDASLKAVLQPGTKLAAMDDAVPTELMELDPFPDPMAGGSWMEDCENTGFPELSPSSSASLFSAPFFSLFSFSPGSSVADDLERIQDQNPGNIFKEEQKSIMKEEQAFEPQPMISPWIYNEISRADASSSHQGQFLRLEDYQHRNTSIKPVLMGRPDCGQGRNPGIPENSFVQSYNDPKESSIAELVSVNRAGDFANRKSELAVDVRWRTLDTSDGSSLLKERMNQALRYIKESAGQILLAQVWVPVKRGSKCVLTTRGQPFVLNPGGDRLTEFRTVSLNYVFSAEEDSDDLHGLPGRVFLKKMPEWTPDVQYYSSTEYPRVIHAQQYNVRGTLALPMFESENQSCVGVVELIMTTQKIHYAPEFEKVCQALQAVNLRSSEVLEHPKLQIPVESRQTVLPEILEVLIAACETHKLPLAQTWVPCRHRNIVAGGSRKKGSCIGNDCHSGEQVCMSTIIEACYGTDSHMLGFQEACSEQHLLKGQGVPGKAFASNQPYFSEDITTFSKMEYPLVHYARMFGLRASVGIRLRSTYSGTDDYVLEFFLPVDCKDIKEQHLMLNSLSNTMQHVCRSLRMVSDKELPEKFPLEITEGFASGRVNPQVEIQSGKCPNLSIDFKEVETSPSIGPIQGLEWKEQGPMHLPLQTPEGGDRSRRQIMQQPVARSPSAINYQKQQLCHDKLAIFDQKQHQPDSAEIDNNNFSVQSLAEGSSSFSVQENMNTRRGLEKRRGKVEKSISLAVLQQYFAGSLKDAAKSIGVCPTTLKRICRQHGISRWPSRKISKVNRSLRKLQGVIESVQGVEGAFKIGHFASGAFSPTAIPNLWTADVKGETSHMAKIAPPHSHEETFSDKTSPGMYGSIPEKLPISQNLSLAGLATGLPSLLVCKEKAGDHVHPEAFTHERSAVSVEGLFLQEEEGHISNVQGTAKSTVGSKGFGSPTCIFGTPKSSECSQSSSSSHPWSTEAEPNDPVTSAYASPQTFKGNDQVYGHKEPGTFPVLKRACSENVLNDRIVGLSIRSSNFKCLDVALHNAQNARVNQKFLQEASQSSSPKQGSSLIAKNKSDRGSEHKSPADGFQTGRIIHNESMLTTVKATYKDDTIRFKLSPDTGFQELREEVAKRFQLESGTINLRYLDDDLEWVLLTCDTDLFECIDILKLSGGRTIKLSVQDVCPNIGSSCGSSGEL